MTAQSDDSSQRLILDRAVRDLEHIERLAMSAEEKAERVRKLIHEGNGQPAILLTLARMQDSMAAQRDDHARRITALELVNRRLTWMVIGTVVAAVLSLVVSKAP